MKTGSESKAAIPLADPEHPEVFPNADAAAPDDARPIPSTQRDGARSLVEHMRGRARGGMSTDEIMALTRGEA